MQMIRIVCPACRQDFLHKMVEINEIVICPRCNAKIKLRNKINDVSYSSKILCDLCGCNEIRKINHDLFICQSCGCQYTADQAKNLFNKCATNNIQFNNNEYIGVTNLLLRAEQFYNKGYIDIAEKYCNKILDINIDSLEAINLLEKIKFYKLIYNFGCYFYDGDYHNRYDNSKSIYDKLKHYMIYTDYIKMFEKYCIFGARQLVGYGSESYNVHEYEKIVNADIFSTILSVVMYNKNYDVARILMCRPFELTPFLCFGDIYDDIISRNDLLSSAKRNLRNKNKLLEGIIRQTDSRQSYYNNKENDYDTVRGTEFALLCGADPNGKTKSYSGQISLVKYCNENKKINGMREKRQLLIKYGAVTRWF